MHDKPIPHWTLIFNITDVWKIKSQSFCTPYNDCTWCTHFVFCGVQFRNRVNRLNGYSQNNAVCKQSLSVTSIIWHYCRRKLAIFVWLILVELHYLPHFYFEYSRLSFYLVGLHYPPHFVFKNSKKEKKKLKWWANFTTYLVLYNNLCELNLSKHSSGMTFIGH